MGNPLRVILSAGQIADIECAAQTIEDLPAQAVIADKGYDADHFVAKIEAAGAQAVIPPHSPIATATAGYSSLIFRHES